MKIYAVALLAMKPDESALIATTVSHSVPALIPAPSIDEAAARCREHCFNRWKPEEGWHTWQAILIPVTEQFYNAAFAALEAGIIDTADEPGQAFNFTPGDEFARKEIAESDWPDVIGE